MSNGKEQQKISYSDYHRIWMNVIKPAYESATNNDGYKFSDMVRYSADLDSMIFESVKIETYPKLASHFLYKISVRHPFFDGNKRTALLMGLLVFSKPRLLKTVSQPNQLQKIVGILINQIDTTLLKLTDRTDKEIVDFMVNTANNEVSQVNIRKFLKKHVP